MHVTWALAAGATLEDRPVYNKTKCFDAFPFPNATEDQKHKIRELAETLDAHRKRQQEQYPGLGLTEMYNALAKLRDGGELTSKERAAHEQGLVSVLRQLHDDLDRAVAEAYGWPSDLPEQELLVRLVALNAERAREEANGVVRWLRPEYQNPAGTGAGAQGGFDLGEAAAAPVASPAAKIPWPKTLPEQVAAVRGALASANGPVTAETVARTFVRGRAKTVAELLATLAAIGQAREVEPGEYVT